jgi:hypothetical protein
MPPAERVSEHRHRWVGVDFYLDADRPMMLQTCACGAERRLRAFNRSWTPDQADEQPTPTGGIPIS